MGRPNRWETYCDGRRPDKPRLVAEVVKLIKALSRDTDSVVWALALDEHELERDLSKLRLETLAVLEDVLPRVEDYRDAN